MLKTKHISRIVLLWSTTTRLVEYWTNESIDQSTKPYRIKFRTDRIFELRIEVLPIANTTTTCSIKDSIEGGLWKMFNVEVLPTQTTRTGLTGLIKIQKQHAKEIEKDPQISGMCTVTTIVRPQQRLKRNRVFRKCLCLNRDTHHQSTLHQMHHII